MEISKLLIFWYKNNARDLPWRHSRDPYKIWISEIILQQTRIDQGLSYYENFINKFPDIEMLALANEFDVIKAWEGLGYYSRARNLHFSAKTILYNFNGKFPQEYKNILSLKGIGPYTAGAIASIAFQQPYPAIDGNVKRVISRLFALDKNIMHSSALKEIESIVLKIMDPNQAGTFNQALMDLGAMICKPTNPKCDHCPLQEKCEAFNTHRVEELPVSYKKTSVRKRNFNYFLIFFNDSIIIKQRIEKDIWLKLYDFPLQESSDTNFKLDDIEFLCKEYKLNQSQLTITKISQPIIHILSHQRISAKFIHLEVSEKPDLSNKNCLSIKNHELNKYPFPRLIEKYLIQSGIMEKMNP